MQYSRVNTPFSVASKMYRDIEFGIKPVVNVDKVFALDSNLKSAMDLKEDGDHFGLQENSQGF